MDLVLSIFQQLGADKSIFVQFVIVTIMFVLSKHLFFGHLQNVLDTREDKTTKLAGAADKQFEEVNQMAEQYKEKIQAANKDLKSNLDTSKNDIIKSAEARYRTSETESNSHVEASRKEIEAEVKSQEEQVLSQAQNLADNLVEKITKG